MVTVVMNKISAFKMSAKVCVLTNQEYKKLIIRIPETVGCNKACSGMAGPIHISGEDNL
jgi:hypothetical protein